MTLDAYYDAVSRAHAEETKGMTMEEHARHESHRELFRMSAEAAMDQRVRSTRAKDG